MVRVFGGWAFVLLSFAVTASGCDQLGGKPGSEAKSEEADEDEDKKKKKKKKSDDDDDGEESTAKPKSKETSKPTATAAPTETAASPTPTTPPDTSPTATGVAPPEPPKIAGRSAVPTQEEWAGVGEVTVLGSSKLGCETKGVREWIRVSCRGDDRQRGTPTGVSLTKGGGKGDTFTFASGGVASLVYPFFEGQHIEATFSWQRTRKGFKAEWPRGAPKPTAYGIFEGGDAHLKPKK